LDSKVNLTNCKALKYNKFYKYYINTKEIVMEYLILAWTQQKSEKKI